MIQTVTKRDGRTEPFCKEKICKAINKAIESTNPDPNADYSSIVNRIANTIHKNESESMTVEEIQDQIENMLMRSSLVDTAKAYIRYRDRRNKEREKYNKVNQQVRDILLCNNIQNLNANVDERSFGGRKNESANVIHKEMALNENMRPTVAQAHRDSVLYTHDLSEYNIGDHNCLFVDIKKQLAEGFATRNGSVRAANSFQTACQLVAVIFQCQSQNQFGGVASCHIDYDLAPYVKKSFRKMFLEYYTDVENYSKEEAIETILAPFEPIEIDNEKLKEHCSKAYQYAMKRLEREGRQSAEGLYHNLNTLESRAGSQLPFSSINMGTDTSTEGRLVTKWLLEASIAGTGEYNETPIFPISIFKYKKGINDKPNTPNYDLKQLAIKSLCKRIYPNWVNCNFTQNIEDPNNPDTEMATMGCRTMLGYDRHGLGYSKVGRGNVCPVTINLPKIGIHNGICLSERESADIEGFWKELHDILELTEEALVDRFFYICSQSVKAAPFMYNNGTITDYENALQKGIYESMKHGTLAMGYIGIAEMCQALFGKDHSEDPEVCQFALSVVKYISDYAKEASKRRNLNFSCYATPAENLCKTYAMALQKEFGKIPKVCDRDYITNSHHVPVWQKVSIYKKLEIEAPFCIYPTGGCITYIELEASVMHNHKAVESIIDYAMDLNIPYLALNFPIDTCVDCGYQSEINDTCPKCGSNNITHLRRVTGYITVDYMNFNKGKIAECLDRVKHSKYTSFNTPDNNS